MYLSSPDITIDDRLLAVEELFRQRQYQTGIEEFLRLEPGDFEARPPEYGLYLLLASDSHLYRGNYAEAVEAGLQAARILADYALNRRYARVQLVLSKAYWSLGEMKNAEIRARDALSSYRRANDRSGQVDALNQLAGLAYIRCDYQSAVSFLEDAQEMVSGDARKVAQLTGNLGRTRIRTGQWEQAELDLTSAIERNRQEKQDMSLAMNLLSLGYLQLRRRQFILSGRSLDAALEIICRLDLKRERVIWAEYAGELAFERGDIFKAKAILSDAYQRGLTLAAQSGLVSQSARRLAEVELTLDNLDEAMKYGQKALDLALMIGEKLEAGLARSVIARCFAARADYQAAAEHLHSALDVLREVGDPFELGRTLLAMVGIQMSGSDIDQHRVRAMLDEAFKHFRRLGLEYWMAEANYQSGVLYCRAGDLSSGFKKLSRAEKTFAALNATARVRAVAKFLRGVSDQAVALSISDENEFKIFGNLITADEYTDLKTRDMAGIMQVLARRTGANRALILVPGPHEAEVTASFAINPSQVKTFVEGFSRLLGEEVARTKPTLILDARRDPFINGLFADVPDPVCSVMVVPFKTGDGISSYLYLDRLSQDNRLDPFDQTQLNFAVGFSDLIAFKWAEIQKNQLLEDNRRLRTQLQEQAAFPNIVTRSDAMLRLLSQVRQVVNSDIAICIEGETGSGKDLLARAIHYNSDRCDKRFISINCAALPETLLESELFGYKRGAFTGADRDKAGLFEEADGGTFFLDEIADMPLSIQAKVLRILENQELTRLGDTAPRKVNVRVLSATNRDLQAQMAEGRFRQDLYYRMAAMTFRLPPLRERPEDIPLLTSHFLRDSGKTVTPEAMQLLLAYSWPGNVRELENEVKRMALLSADKPVIETAVVSPKIVASAGLVAASGVGPRPVATLDDIVFSHGYSLYDYLAEHERRFLIQALKAKGKVKKHAAALLNIPESTLRLKLKQYDIDLDNL